ncbi:MAG TPA: polysaccharide deacetylase family protein [Candidatus Saccharimonadales bacterium]|nr:polysaccharide deacetylase family protein [Candidatus Saccharimonadales bacterium]
MVQRRTKAMSTGNSTVKQLAVTFDDGPNEPFTSQLLDYLDSVGVKVTFFQVGSCIARYPHITARAFTTGHIIANHSYSHALHKYLSQPHLRQEISDTQDLIRSITGKSPLLFRAPWFLLTPAVRRTVAEKSLTAVGGALPHPIEITQPDARSIANHALKHARPGAILIFHDGYRARGGNRTQTIEAAKITIAALLQAGYQLVTVDKLLGVKAYE